MPKVKFNAMWIKPHPELKLDGENLFCTACSKIITVDTKFHVDQHIKTAKHVSYIGKIRNGGKGQQSLKQLFVSQASGTNDKKQFNEDLCKALVASNIPLKKLNNENLRFFLEKYCKFNIPDESTLRKKSVDSIFTSTMNNIRNAIGENYFYVIVDETTDVCGRYIVHLLIGALEENVPGNSFLIASKQLEKANNITVTRFIQDTMTIFFLPNVVPSNKFVIFLSDAAPYMVKTGQNLKFFYDNLVHITCLAHGVNRVAETIREQFPLVNDLISNVKKVFLKAPLRIQLYKERLPDLQLPPQPVLTRWGTWLNAAVFYSKNFEGIKNVINEISDSSLAVVTSKALFGNKEVHRNLIFIRQNYSFIPDAILSLEKKCQPLFDSVEIVENFQNECDRVKCKIGKIVSGKLKIVLENKEGFKTIRSVSKILEGNFNGETKFSEEVLSKLKYAPITSVDVERSFSLYKHMFTDKRHNFTTENFEKHLIINSFYNKEEDIVV